MKPIKVTGIGADVEMFLQDRKNSEVVSAEGYIKGEKNDPFVFDLDNPHFASSLDNVLAEVGIPPATNKVEFYNYLRKSIGFINSTIPQNLKAVALPAAILDDRFLMTDQAKTFGCEPDYNAYTRRQNQRPYSPNPNLRSAGGHLHIGYENAPAFNPLGFYDSIEDIERCSIIQALDLHIGVPSVILEPDNDRKTLYGKAGAYRPKVYGVEYRTPSNFYLQSRKLTMWMYEAVNNAIDWLNDGNFIDNIMGEHISNTINNNDKYEAQNLIDQFQLKVA